MLVFVRISATTRVVGKNVISDTFSNNDQRNPNRSAPIEMDSCCVPRATRGWTVSSPPHPLDEGLRLPSPGEEALHLWVRVRVSGEEALH